MLEEPGSLRKFLEYELAAAERYRRFVSIVMVGSRQGAEKARQVLKGTLRSSDVMEQIGDAAVVLMGETDSEGALCAIERYKDRCGRRHDMRFSIVTFPTDEAEPDALFSTGNRRLEQAMAGDFGAVVATD
ncbi:MAG TPA: hypothetical protein HPP83_05280 [Candidatus Hydrogenedentes bacterium]|nr:hypothetical protein [Candidatus Hydrogenedentota bacterium]